MGIHVKVSSSGSSTDWRSIKKIWAKTGTAESPVWSPVKALFSKVANGWTKMWPGNPPSVDPDDPIRIRIGGYSGTGSGTSPLYSATSPQLFCSTDAGTSGTFLKLWGDDGSYDGLTPIILSDKKMKVSTNIDGLVDRTAFTSVDTADFAIISQADRDYAEGYYTFYELKAKNDDGEIIAYSQPIKVIKRRPALVSTAVLSEYGGSLTGSSSNPEVNAQIRWGWWIRPGGYLGGTPLLRWWKNTSKTPGGTLLESINITNGYDSVSGTVSPTFSYDYNTSNVLTIYDNCGHTRAANEYIVAELYLENSYTAHYAAPVSFYGSTGNAPTITSVSLRTYDGQVDTVMDNQSDPRIVSQAYFEIVAQVANYESGTTFNFEPKFYKADTGDYLNYTTGATISNGTAYSFPTDLSPYSVEVSGTSATVVWRTYINSNFLPPNPTYGGGQAKYQFNFRLSATKPGGSILYYTGIVSSNHAGTTIYPTYMNDDGGGVIGIHPHTQGVLTADNYTVGSAPQTIRFSVTGNSYPSGNASYPRSYGIDFGDGRVENLAWPTGTSNPSYTTWDHTYTTNGVFTAKLITVPQGFTTIGTRQQVINVGGSIATPTSLTATTNRQDGVNLIFGGSSNATGYNIFWNYTANGNPINNVTQGDFLNKSSPFLDTTILSLATRYYWVQARGAVSDGYSTGVSPWFPAGDGIIGTRAEATSYTVTWNAQGGSTGNEGSPWSFTEGGSVTVPSVSRIGYTFVRWTDRPSGDYTYTTTGGTFSPPAENITMYARWQVNVCIIPNVIGETESDAGTIVNEAGFLYEFTEYLDTTDPGLVGKVAAIYPAVGTQPGCASNVTLTIYRAAAAIAPTVISGASPVITRTSNTYNYSTTNGSWNNSPTSYSYQWKAQVSLPYPPYYSTVDVGTNSSSYTSSSTYDYYSIYCVVTASNAGGVGYASSNSIQNTPVVTGSAPLNNGNAPSINPTSGTAGGTTYTCDPGGWTGSPTPTITYQWQYNDQGSLFLNISGATSSTYSPPANFLSTYFSPIRCKVTATNTISAVSAFSNQVSVGAYVPPSSVPSGGGVTLTPAETQPAGTQICANVSVMSGTNPITYSTVIRKATGQTPTASTGTTVSSGTGTGNAVCCHTITDNEASGTPDHFKAYTTGSNSAGNFVVGSNIVISTPAATTTTTTTTTTTAEPNCGIMPYVIGMTESAASTAITNRRIAYEYTYYTSDGATASNNGTVQSQDPASGYNTGSCNYGYNASLTLYSYTAPTTAAPTTAAPTTAAPTTTTVNCSTCNSYSPSDGSYSYTTTDPYGTCTSGERYYRVCVTPGSCPNITQYGGCVPAATTAAPTTTAAPCISRFRCKSYDVTNSASNNYYDCYTVNACTAPNNSDGSRASCCA